MLDVSQATSFDSFSAEALKKECSDCKRCGLHQGRTQAVFGVGPIPCPLMIIGEAPGANEDEQGVPFIGRAGQLLTKILDSVGIDRNKQVFITNTVKCRPPDNRTPHPTEIEACKGFLIRQINLVQPRVLILLGTPSLKTILEEKLPISQVRGKWFHMAVPYMEDPLYVMPMFHPSYLLRHDNKEKGSPKWLTWQDAQEVKAAISFYLSTEE